MQIVIDIPEVIYEALRKADVIISDQRSGKSLMGKMLMSVIFNAVAKGTVLPRGHGRLFDERDIVNGNYEIIGNKIYEVEPIIEADNPESYDNAGWCNTCEYKYLESKCLGCAKYDEYGNLITLSKYKKESEDNE